MRCLSPGVHSTTRRAPYDATVSPAASTPHDSPEPDTPVSLGLTRHSRGARPDPDSTLNLAGFFQTGSGSLRFSGDLDGRGLAIFQHQYMIFAGTTTIPVIHTVYVVEVSPHWPSVTIARRSPWSWIGRLFGRSPGLMLDDPNFNRAFRVNTENEDFAIALLAPDLQRFLLTKRGVTWRISLGRLALFYSGKLRENRIAPSLDRLRGFLQRTPDELEAWGM